MTIRQSIQLCSLAALALLFTGCSAMSDTVADAKELFGVLKEADIALTKTDGAHVVLVPGYGSPVIGNAGYESYVDSAIRYIEDPTNGVDVVVFSGAPSVLATESEAESLNRYFNSAADLDYVQSEGIRVYKEECAILSWQNVSNSEDVLIDAGITPTEVTIFGSTDREDKLRTFGTAAFNTDGAPDDAKDVLSSALNYVSVNFEGYNFNSSVEDERVSQATFLAEIAGAYDADIANQIMRRRIDDWTAKFGYDVADNLVKSGCTQYEGFR